MTSLPPKVGAFNPLTSPDIQQFKNYLPVAYSDELTLLQKVNYLIQFMQTMTDSYNDIGTTWADVVSWVTGDGLTTAVDNQLITWDNDGTLATIINQEIFDNLNTSITNVKSSVGVYLEDFPLQTGETDDTARINRAIASITTPQELKFKAGTTYKISSGLVIDSSLITLVGRGTVIDATALTSGSAITFTGSAIPPYNQKNFMEGIEVLGSGKTNAVTAFTFEKKNASNGEGPSRLSLKNVVAHDFGTLLYFGDNAYAINFEDCQFYNGTTVITTPDTVANGGERISFSKSTFFNSVTIVNVSNPNADFYFSECSFDYSNTLISTVGAKVFCKNCHFENNPTNIPSISADGDGGIVSIDGGWMLQSSNGTVTTDAYFNAVSSNALISIRDVFLHNITTTTDYIGKGSGRILTSNIQTNNVSQISVLKAPNENLLSYPSFETGSIVDNIFLIDDTSTLTNRYTGDNIQLAIDTTTSNTGTNSLKITKTNGTGSNASFGIAVPVKSFSLIGAQLFIKMVSGSGTVELDRTVGLLEYPNNGVPKIRNGQTIDSMTITPTSSFVKHNLGTNSAYHIPEWATHFILKVNLFNFVTGQINIDDIVITQY